MAAMGLVRTDGVGIVPLPVGEIGVVGLRLGVRAFVLMPAAGFEWCVVLRVLVQGRMLGRMTVNVAGIPVPF